MFKRLIALFTICLFSTLSFASVNNVTEEDGSPSVYPWKLKFANGSVTDNGDSTASVSAGAGVAIGTPITSGTPGSTLFVGGTASSPTFAQDNQNFYWNDTLNDLNVMDTLGSEKLTNGTFTGSATGWTLNSGWAYSSNTVLHSSNGTGTLTNSTSANIVIGELYQLTYTISAWTVGTVTPSLGGVTGTAVGANGTYTERFTATATTAVAFTPTNTARFTIDSVSLKRLSGGAIRTGYLDLWTSQSNSSPGTTRIMSLNNYGSGTWLDFNFSGTLKSSIGASSGGNLDLYQSGGSGVTFNTIGGSQYSYNYPTAFVHTAGGWFGGSVSAGSVQTPTSTLQSAGGTALKVKRITASQTLDDTATHWLCDATTSAACTGTPSTTTCSTYTASGQSTCESHLPCSWYAGSSCSAFDNEFGMGTCSGTSGCSASTSACSGGDQSTCEAGDDSYGGSCTWSATGDCTAYNDNFSTCSGTSGCSWSGGGYDCSLSDGTDQGTCEGNAGCTWNAGDNTCSGTCSGNYDACSGTYYTGSCTGTYGQACNGTVTCASYGSSAPCNAETGCTWTTQMNVTLPNMATYPDRTYFIQNDTSSGADVVIYPETTTNPATTVNKTSTYTLSNYKDGVHIAPYRTSADCSGLGSQGACEAETGCTWTPNQCSDYNGTDQTTCESGHSGCTWSDPTCSGTWGGSCGGTYYTSKDWAIYTNNETTSGTYTPTLSNTTNVGASTARLATYMRVGNTVTVAGQLDIDPTATGAVLLGISLPIASNFSTVYQLGGAGSTIAIANESYGIEADTTNDRASMKNIAVSTANHTVTYTFTYQVI